MDDLEKLATEAENRARMRVLAFEAMRVGAMFACDLLAGSGLISKAVERLTLKEVDLFILRQKE